MSRTSNPTEVPLGPAARQGNTAFAVSVAFLLLRLALGWTFVYTGSQKAFGAFDGLGLEGFAKILGGLGLPGFLSPLGWSYVVAYGELIGGISVLFGLLTRLGTLPLIVTMCVAIAKVLGPNGFGGRMGENGLQIGYQNNVTILAMCAALLIAGPGIISLDALLFRRGLWARGAQPLSEPGRRG